MGQPQGAGQSLGPPQRKGSGASMTAPPWGGGGRRALSVHWFTHSSGICSGSGVGRACGHSAEQGHIWSPSLRIFPSGFLQRPGHPRKGPCPARGSGTHLALRHFWLGDVVTQPSWELAPRANNGEGSVCAGSVPALGPSSWLTWGAPPNLPVSSSVGWRQYYQ